MAAPVAHHLAGEIHQRQVDVVDRQTDANRIDRVRLELQKGAWPSTRLGCFGLLALQAQDQSLVQKIGGDGRHRRGTQPCHLAEIYPRHRAVPAQGL